MKSVSGLGTEPSSSEFQSSVLFTRPHFYEVNWIYTSVTEQNLFVRAEDQQSIMACYITVRQVYRPTGSQLTNIISAHMYVN